MGKTRSPQKGIKMTVVQFLYTFYYSDAFWCRSLSNHFKTEAVPMQARFTCGSNGSRNTYNVLSSGGGLGRLGLALTMPQLRRATTQNTRCNSRLINEHITKNADAVWGVEFREQGVGSLFLSCILREGRGEGRGAGACRAVQCEALEAIHPRDDSEH